MRLRARTPRLARAAFVAVVSSASVASAQELTCQDCAGCTTALSAPHARVSLAQDVTAPSAADGACIVVAGDGAQLNGGGHALLGRIRPQNRFTRAYRQLDADPDEPRDVDWVSGAALWFRRSALDRIGGWDERFFMFLEDVDVCRSLAGAGGRRGPGPWGRAVLSLLRLGLRAARPVLRRLRPRATRRLRPRGTTLRRTPASVAMRGPLG